jgi:peptide/nickel transport system substrate-binding protein
MKRFRRRLLVSAALVVLSCARREAPQKAPSVLSRHLVGDPATLDPTVTSEESGLVVEDLLFRPLVGIDAARKPVPALATSWTVSPDGLSYELHLDPQATWEDGKSVTSDDVRFTIDRVRDPKVNAVTWSGGFEDLVAIETPDPVTVRLRFSKPYAGRMIAFALPIVSASAFATPEAAKQAGRHPFGSGPYRFVSWETNQKILLARRSDARDAKFDQVVFRVIPDSAVRYQAGLRGELDEFRLTRDQFQSVASSPEFLAKLRSVRVPQFLEVMVVWNCKSPLLDDARVRRALALALPRSDLAKSLYPPDGATLVSGPYPPGVAGNADEVKPPAHDPAESARLLDAAGWKAGPDGVRRRAGRKATLELLSVAGQPVYAQIAEVMRQAYEKVGVEIALRALDWATYTQRGDRGEFDGQLTARQFQPPDLDPFIYYHSSQWAPKGLNNGFYSNREADPIMERARQEVDPARRVELLRAVHRLLAADPPGDFLWGADQPWALAKRLDGVEVSDIGLFHFLPGPLAWRPAGEKVASARRPAAD